MDDYSNVRSQNFIERILRVFLLMRRLHGDELIFVRAAI